MPPRPNLQKDDAQKQDRIARAHALMAGNTPDDAEDPIIQELDSALQAATAALQKLKGAEKQEQPEQDADTGSPSMQGMP